jgi:hypothetical protein
MVDSTSISGPVIVKADSRERVALELMDKISHSEEIDRGAPRQYWLGLYRHCWHAVQGHEPEKIQERPRRG